MRSESKKPTATGTDDDLSPTEIFELLTHQRRRHALRYLVRRVGAVHLGELAEHVALREGDPTRDRYERVLTGLVHTHVPKLADAGVVRYDPDRKTLKRQQSADQLAPFLTLAEADDVR